MHTHTHKWFIIDRSLHSEYLGLYKEKIYLLMSILYFIVEMRTLFIIVRKGLLEKLENGGFLFTFFIAFIEPHSMQVIGD